MFKIPTKLNKGLQNSHKIAFKVKQMPSKFAQNSIIDINSPHCKTKLAVIGLSLEVLEKVLVFVPAFLGNLRSSIQKV